MKKLISFCLMSLAFAQNAEAAEDLYFPCDSGSTYHYYTKDSLLFKDSIIGMRSESSVLIAINPEYTSPPTLECLRQRTMGSKTSTLDLGSYKSSDMDTIPNLWMGLLQGSVLIYTLNAPGSNIDGDTNHCVRFDNLTPFDGRYPSLYKMGKSQDTLWTDMDFQVKYHSRNIFQSGGLLNVKTRVIPQLGVISMDYSRTTRDPMIQLLQIDSNIDSLDFNPSLQSFRLRYVTRGTDTLYNADLPANTPVLAAQQNSIESGGNTWALVLPFAGNMPLHAEYIDAAGRISKAQWTREKDHILVVKPAGRGEYWLRLSQGNDWRIYKMVR